MKTFNFIAMDKKEWQLFTHMWASGFEFNQANEMLKEHTRTRMTNVQWDSICKLLDQQYQIEQGLI